MPDNRNNKGGRDRQRVAGGERYEVSYESRKTGASANEVKKAIKEVGNSRKKVESRLSGRKK